MPWPFLVALAGIAWLAYVSYLEHQRKLAKTAGLGAGEADALARRIEAAEAEAVRLRQRIEHLEAIVTDDAFELERDARAALAAAAPPRLDLPDDLEGDLEPERAPARRTRS